jgi:peptide/nickel transport system permease protein
MPRLRLDALTVVAVAVLALVALGSVSAPLWVPAPPDAIDLRATFQPPGPGRWLGTDDLGRDVLSRVAYAGRVSLPLAFAAAAMAVAFGGVVGGAAGFLGGRVDSALGAVVDTFLSVPALALAMVASAFVELTTGRLAVIIALVSWPTIARLVRAQVLSLKARPFAEAAVALGARPTRVLVRHLLPGTLTPVVVAATLLIATAILVEAALSFLGFGVPPPTPTWGGMLNDAQPYYREAPWLAVFPGLVIALVVASVNLLGEALRRWAQPRAES